MAPQQVSNTILSSLWLLAAQKPEEICDLTETKTQFSLTMDAVVALEKDDYLPNIYDLGTFQNSQPVDVGKFNFQIPGLEISPSSFGMNESRAETKNQAIFVGKFGN